MLKLLMKTAGFIGLVLAIGWTYSEPKRFDGWVATFASLTVLIGLYLPDTLRKVRGQTQEVGPMGIGIQAGGDVNLNINSTRDEI